VERENLKQLFRAMIEKNNITDGFIYLQITRGAAPRKKEFPKDAQPIMTMTIDPFDFQVELKHNTGGKAITWPDDRWSRADIKTIAQLPLVMAAQAAAEAGAIEALLVDGNGNITEASASNFWIVDDNGTIVTRPSSGRAILKGVTRTAVLELCKKEGIRIEEREISVEDACNAKEAFVTGALKLVTAITHIDGKQINDGEVGPVVKKLLDLYRHYVDHPEDINLKWSA